MVHCHDTCDEHSFYKLYTVHPVELILRRKDDSGSGEKKLKQTILIITHVTLKGKGMHAHLIPAKNEDLNCAENTLSLENPFAPLES